MNRRIQNFLPGAALVVLALGLAACDLSGVGEIGDDFDLVIELQPVNTLVTGQVIDLETLEPVEDVQLTFSGANGADVIDIYSDPISAVRAESGVLTFGIDNAVAPSEAAPATFVVEAAAEGYFTERAEVTLDEVGRSSVTLRLTPRDVTSQVPGTAGVKGTVQADAEAGLAQEVTISTPQRQDVEAQASLSLGQGARPLAADGTPLTGAIDTEMRVFDTSAGIEALPSAMKQNEAGEEVPVLGAVYLRMADQSGRVATTFAGSGAGKTAASCAASITQEISDPFFQSLVRWGYYATHPLPIYMVPLLEGEVVEVGAVQAEIGNDDVVRYTICFGGPGANVDMSKLAGRDLSQGFFLAVAGFVLPMSTLTHVTVDNSANDDPVLITKLQVDGLGVVKTFPRAIAVPAGGERAVGLGAKLPSGAEGNVVAVLATGERVSQSFTVPEDASFDRTFVLPAVATETYAVSASISCPAGQKFSPQLTDKSFSGLSLQYRAPGVRTEFATAGGDLDISYDESSVTASASITLVPGQPYLFKAVYGKKTTFYQNTAPTTGNTIDVSVDASHIGGLECTSM